jgi:hypothetical protein
MIDITNYIVTISIIIALAIMCIIDYYNKKMTLVLTINRLFCTLIIVFIIIKTIDYNYNIGIITYIIILIILLTLSITKIKKPIKHQA